MGTSKPYWLIGIGFACVVLGVAGPLLMILGVIPSTFFLGFLSFAISVSGVMLGIIGAAMAVGRRQDNDY